MEDIVFRAIRSSIELIEGTKAEKRALMKADEKEKRVVRMDAEKEKDRRKRELEGLREAVYVCSNESVEIRWRYGDFWEGDSLNGRDSK